MSFAESVTVVIATYGEAEWRRIAERAVDSAYEAGALHVVQHHHAATLHEARNAGAAKVETEWLCFLDADDMLEDGYFDAMGSAPEQADIRAPLARYVHKDGREEPPRVPPGSLDLRNANTIVIGAVHRKTLHDAIGGFKSWGFYEDWDYWQRCWKAGASVEFVERAVYRAFVRPNSRNRRPRPHQREAMHHAIRKSNFPELYPAAS